MIELSWLIFLLSHFSWHLVFYSTSESFKAQLAVVCESVTTILCNNTDTIGCSLTKTSTLVFSKTGNSLHNSAVVLETEIGWAQVLNHIVKNEQTELHSLLNLAAECFLKCLGPQDVNDVSDHRGLSLEKSTDQLSGSQLKIVFVVSLFFEKSKIFLI